MHVGFDSGALNKGTVFRNLMSVDYMVIFKANRYGCTKCD